ncbi:MAG: isoprenyl transferase [Rickettsiales bacterium]
MPEAIRKNIKNKTLPKHVAIIMDGNGRWAKSRGMPRTAGHKKGADSLRLTLEACEKKGIKYLTVYAFSSENWKRPNEEINDLMQLLQHYLHKELEKLHERKIRLHFIGDLSKLKPEIYEQIEHAIELTKTNNDFHLIIALSYGSKQEIVRATQKIAGKIADGELKIDDVDEDILAQNLDTKGLPEPDLLIRTGGEKRLSNFLLWQSAYTELCFSDILWPDFDEKELTLALDDFATRERRYGTSQ